MLDRFVYDLSDKLHLLFDSFKHHSCHAQAAFCGLALCAQYGGYDFKPFIGGMICFNM